MYLYFPASREATIEFIKYLDEKGWLKKTEGIYEEIPALTEILAKLFEEQQNLFKQYLSYKGID